jgi:hypothetical protein
MTNLMNIPTPSVQHSHYFLHSRFYVVGSPLTNLQTTVMHLTMKGWKANPQQSTDSSCTLKLFSADSCIFVHQGMARSGTQDHRNETDDPLKWRNTLVHNNIPHIQDLAWVEVKNALALPALQLPSVNVLTDVKQVELDSSW